ncbi:MAG TPA: TadE family protein [Candidatus Limnocylindrales bacterium]|nr:TadE family protein [Candidatus Limnocylindrales bacterium]
MYRRPPGNAGQSVAEFAIVVPILLLLLFTIFDFARLFYAYNTLSNAAADGARKAIVDQSLVPGQTYSVAAKEAADQATALGLDPGDPTEVSVAYRSPNLSDPCPSRAIGCIAEVRVQYQFTAMTPLIGGFFPIKSVSAISQMPIERTYP